MIYILLIVVVALFIGVTSGLMIGYLVFETVKGFLAWLGLGGELLIEGLSWIA